MAYTILAFVLVRLLDILSPVIGTGQRAIQVFTVALILGFPVIVLFAWAYEITPEGLKPTSQVDKTQSITRETGRKLNLAVAVLFAVAVAVLLADRFL